MNLGSREILETASSGFVDTSTVSEKVLKSLDFMIITFLLILGVAAMRKRP